MSKPAHRFETRLAVAYQSPQPTHPAFDGDARAESFVLRFHDGRVGQVTFGLCVQHADAVAASDPGLAFAARAWLAARGQRNLQLSLVDRGRDIDTLACGPFGLDALSDAADGCGLRVVTLCPSNTELVDALGCMARVMACDSSSDHPAEVCGVERLGYDLSPALERVVALAPDLAVSSLAVPGMERVVTGLYARGVPQVVLAPRCVDEVLDGVVRLAHALGVSARGSALREQLQAERAALIASVPTRACRVYLEWWPKPMFTPGRDCYSNELIALAGGCNVFGEAQGASVRVSAEDVVRAEPEVCFVSWCGAPLEKLDPERLRRREGFEALVAAREGRVYALDEAFSGRPGPRMFQAARLMSYAIGHAEGEPRIRAQERVRRGD